MRKLRKSYRLTPSRWQEIRLWAIADDVPETAALEAMILAAYRSRFHDPTRLAQHRSVEHVRHDFDDDHDPPDVDGNSDWEFAV